MKIKITFIMCAFVCALLVYFQWPTALTAQSPTSPASDKSETHGKNQNLFVPLEPNILTTAQPATENHGQKPDHTMLQDTIKQGYGDGAVTAKDAMEAFLKTWNPIGRSAQELKETFGKPSEEKTNSITYIFDTGFLGWNFEFVLKNDKVVELRRPASE